MIKYYPESVQVVFAEVPDYMSLAIEITNCPGHCEGCHSPWLREDIGEELTPERLYELIDANHGINCVVFMGEGKDPEALKLLASGIMARYPKLKIALYSGREEVEEEYNTYFDFIKVGPYIPERKALNFETTNQRFYEIKKEIDYETGGIKFERIDITNKFWRKKV
jgi:anaerobic ribonucleoside-triphosphate reductase activating protein